jgi:hypothetical protein
MVTVGNEELVTKAEHLYLIAQRIAEQTPGFFTPLGAGGGNLRSNTFMIALKNLAAEIFEKDYSEAKLCGENKLAIDFYFPEEETAVEIAGMLGAPNSEYEKDIFKCLIAQSRGCKVTKLVFIGKPGAAKAHSYPGRGAIAQFVKEKFGIEISVEELVDPALA